MECFLVVVTAGVVARGETKSVEFVASEVPVSDRGGMAFIWRAAVS